MKKKNIIWMSIIAVVLAALALFVYQQWNSIGAITDAVRYSQEEVEKQLEGNKETLEALLQEEENITVRDLTPEEAQALNEGNLSEEEVIEILTGKPQTPVEEEPPQASSGNINTPTQTEKPKEPTQEEIAEERISAAIAKLYIQKNEYLNRLDEVEARAREEYISLSKEERKTAKSKMLKAYMPEVSAWETECDRVVEGLIDEIRKELKAAGKSESIADEIKTAYLNEKRLKKAYFINRYMD
ncbi:MAG: hypothetical protein IJB80_00895 [Clostridia bacterium]|nr:hypothetical protein [Clostridia bacterium]